MEFARFKTISVLPAFIVTAGAGNVVSEPAAPNFVDAAYSQPDTLPPEVQNASISSPSTLPLREAPTQWTKKMDKRFEELAILEAVGKLNPAQTAELETLTHDRRNLQYPRSPEEVFWEYKQRKVTETLVNAVREYAKFHSGSNRPRPRA